MNRHISSIRIKDFQNHKDTHMTFGPGLTVITGTSDSGKSALYRSLMVAFQDYFRKQDVREDQKNAEITVNFKNGDYFKRTKGAVNEVEYQYQGQQLVKHTKFAKSMPKDVLDFIGHIPKTSTSSLPFANQEDKWFLINASDESLHKEISRLLGIDDLEEAATLLNSEINKISGDIKKVASEIESTKAKLEPFENLDQRIENLDQLKKLIEDYESLESEIAEVENFTNEIAKTYKQYVNCANEKKKYETLEKFYSENIPELTKNFDDISGGLKLIENITSIVAKSKEAEKKYNHFYEIAEGEVGQLISECDDKHIQLSTIQSLDTDLNNTNFEIDTRIENIQRLNDTIAQYDEEIQNLENYARENFERCESCGRFCVCQRI